MPVPCILFLNSIAFFSRLLVVRASSLICGSLPPFLWWLLGNLGFSFFRKAWSAYALAFSAPVFDESFICACGSFCGDPRPSGFSLGLFLTGSSSLDISCAQYGWRRWMRGGETLILTSSYKSGEYNMFADPLDDIHFPWPTWFFRQALVCSSDRV